MPIDDRKRRVQEILDSAPRSVQRSHDGFEQTEPPPPDTSWPPAPVPGVGSPSAYRPRQAIIAGFQTGVAHIVHAAGHIPKRIAVLLAAWGTVSWMGAVAMTYWTSHSVVGLDRYAKDEAAQAVEHNALVRDIEGLRATVNDLRVDLVAAQTAVNVMRQMPIQSAEKKHR